MKKKTFITFSLLCFSIFGIAQTATTMSKTPASEPVKNDTAAIKNPGTPKVVSMDKNASTAPAPEQQTTPAMEEEKTTSSRKRPE